MAITFDPVKNARNIRKRNLSFERVKDFDFQTATFEFDDRDDYGETRIEAIGFLDGRLHVVVFTERGEDPRVIGLRKADRNEMRRYANVKGYAPDAESPEWTEERIRNGVPFSALPDSVKRAILKIQRGPQKAAKKVPVSIRLSPDVVAGLRATGDGWQVRADEALRSWLEQREPVETH